MNRKCYCCEFLLMGGSCMKSPHRTNCAPPMKVLLLRTLRKKPSSASKKYEESIETSSMIRILISLIRFLICVFLLLLP